MFDLTMKTTLVLDDAPMTTNLKSFFEANDFTEGERAEIMTALETEGEYEYPAGASAGWTLRIKDPR